MIAVTSPGFVLFAALLAGLWYACPPPRRWQLLLGANLLFYAVLCPAALPVLAGSSFLVWWCGRRTAKKARVPCGACGGTAAAGPAQVSARCAGLAGHAGERSGHRLFYAAARQLSV